jgi:hypothetical protein
MLLDSLAVIACVLAVLPALMFYRNFAAYAPPPSAPSVADTDVPAVSVLIPARNEAASIGAAVMAALHSEQVNLEVLILDDHSTDATAAIVRHLVVQDARVRLVTAPPLPPGWCGKQHACAVLATHATYPLLVFVDADVRLQPQGLARLATFLQTSGADLVSGLPRQETGTWLEHLLIPLMHFLLLGFLPFWRMRHSRHPAYGTGCGQLFMARREAYAKAGGHSAIRTSLHDGLTLPRAFRSAGLLTDLCDATDIATCRMYRSAREVWHGLAKNATEGLAAPRLIVPATFLLLGGQVLPVVWCAVGMVGGLSAWAFGLALLGVSAVYYPRLQALRRFAQMPLGAVFHPLGIVVLLAIQWYAYGRTWRGRPVTWKERTYPAAAKRA